MYRLLGYIFIALGIILIAGHFALWLGNMFRIIEVGYIQAFGALSWGVSLMPGVAACVFGNYLLDRSFWRR